MGTTRQRQWWLSGAGLALLAVVLVAGAGLIQQLPYWRLDLTQDRLYTLSEGSRQILADINEPIALSFFFSDQVAQQFPRQREFARRVRELLEEYASLSGGKLTLEVVDPEPFSTAEERAAEAGLQGLPGGAGSFAVYFGLLGTNAAGEQQVISLFSLQREAFLEYDISQLIYRLDNAKPAVVGVIASLEVFGGFDVRTRQPAPPWLVIEQLQQLTRVRALDPTTVAIDADVDVLLIIHPRELSAPTRYAIDQFVLRGGRALIFVDPHAEMALPGAGRSALPALFAAWGVAFDPEQVLGDSKWALRLATAEDKLPLPHLGLFGLQDDALHRDDIVTADLENINLATAGSVAPAPGATTRWVPLLTSSDSAMPMASDKFANLRDHGKLLQGFVPTGQRYTLAARVRGPVSSAFPEGPPAAPDAAGPTGQTPHLQASQRDINIVVVADTDMLSDRLWVQVSDFFGQRVAAPWANNGAFVINAVENLSGSADLISVRSRGTYTRPFEVVERLQRVATERFQEQEQILMDKLEQLEVQIQQLSQTEQGEMVLESDAAQRQDIKAFELEKLQVRRDLRQVQHQLRKDIGALETRLLLINAALVPGLLTLGAIGLAWMRRRRRRIRPAV
ncbi:ABC transporter [Exilibacterium tricleocarpae]|uniref:ABC transporter n=1 Tax=Exilibacterium tricleocarpae TaxID=2591008 RepID=A0A545U889_9GAMM|nr:Gldg family protein [Exilibacterium tricleocarpae]TQV85623.1 ABC transporter [Exilibacterium tricleocarpae]